MPSSALWLLMPEFCSSFENNMYNVTFSCHVVSQGVIY